MARKEQRYEGAIQINALFAKYQKNLIAPERTIIVAFCEVVKDLYGWNIKDRAMFSVQLRDVKLGFCVVFCEFLVHEETALWFQCLVVRDLEVMACEVKLLPFLKFVTVSGMSLV